MNTSLKTLFISVMAVLLTSLFVLADSPGKMYDSNSPYHKDFLEIQKLVLKLVQCIQYQDRARLLRHFLPDSTRPSAENLAERECLLQAFDQALSSFNSRSTISDRAGYSTTRDFGSAINNIEFSKDGKQAQLDIYMGFANLPGDESLLEKFSVSEVSNMSAKEKERETKFRLCTLQLVKHDNTWLVRSYGSLARVMSEFSSHQANVEASFQGGNSKIKKK